MTENVNFPLSYPPIIPPQTLVMGSNFFPEQHQHKPTNTFVSGQHVRIQDFLSGGGGGGGRGPGSSLLNLFYSLQRGSNGFIPHFPGGPTFSRGGGVQVLISIKTHITITCDFPGGFGPPIPLWIRTWTMWHFGTNRLRRACAASF